MMKVKKQMIDKGCIFSECRKYRYVLKRIWIPKKGFVVFVCLNPSTADENFDDNTVVRCIGYASSWGYGGMIMLNLFGYISTDRSVLQDVYDPIGPDNDKHIQEWSQNAGLTVAAWGNDGALMNRGINVMKMLKEPHYLALTKNNHPWHPLYLKKDLKPIKFYNSKIWNPSDV